MTSEQLLLRALPQGSKDMMSDSQYIFPPSGRAVESITLARGASFSPHAEAVTP
ncbi:hypothetical protein TVH25_02870 [Rhodococcus sp. 7Tela_A2]|uniref:hypothetical protein n=1 Tax=Rhodococcus sp. 7Tela_A2 TaxID=3093744 RepID=UPI003BB66471